MIKKIIALGVMIIMAVSLTACENTKGSFYSLQEAYEQNWLTQENLKNLAYYYNGESDDENFVPTTKNPESLSTDVENKIKKTHLTGIKKDYPTATVSGIHIVEYYGIYNDCVAVYIKDDYRVIDILVEPEYIVGGILFRNFSSPGLRIWREKNK